VNGTDLMNELFKHNKMKQSLIQSKGIAIPSNLHPFSDNAGIIKVKPQYQQ
jgi:hypothetical protein